MTVKEFRIHYMDMKGKDKIKKVKPTDPDSLLRVKYDIATALNKIKDNVNYYYVVMVVDKDGEDAFRTIIRKTFING